MRRPGRNQAKGQCKERSHKEVDQVIAHIYGNMPRSNTDSAVKISSYGIPRSDEESEPGARWLSTFDEASNALGHDIGEGVAPPKNAHKPYAKSMVNGMLNTQNRFHIRIMF